jgi:exodeoxyribonuclease VII small subunit
MPDDHDAEPAAPSFEEARAELERVVLALEDGGTTLDQALALWQRGEELYRLCRARLDAAEEQIARLSAALEQDRPPRLPLEG